MAPPAISQHYSVCVTAQSRFSLWADGEKPRARRGFFGQQTTVLLDDHLALDFDFHATIRRVGRRSVPSGSSGLQTRPGIGCVLPMPSVSILSLGTPLLDQVVADGVSTTLRQLLVVLLRADRIGMAGDQDQFELLHSQPAWTGSRCRSQPCLRASEPPCRSRTAPSMPA